jgi:hypothetical protein
MRIFFNSENYFMINTRIIRSEIYTRVDMRGSTQEIMITELLRDTIEPRQQQHPLNQMDMPLIDRVGKTTS